MRPESSFKYVGIHMSSIPQEEIGNATIVVRKTKHDFNDVTTCKVRNMPKNAIYLGMAIGSTAKGQHNEALLSLVCYLPS